MSTCHMSDVRSANSGASTDAVGSVVDVVTVVEVSTRAAVSSVGSVVLGSVPDPPHADNTRPTTRTPNSDRLIPPT